MKLEEQLRRYAEFVDGHDGSAGLSEEAHGRRTTGRGARRLAVLVAIAAVTVAVVAVPIVRSVESNSSTYHRHGASVEGTAASVTDRMLAAGVARIARVIGAPTTGHFDVVKTTELRLDDLAIPADQGALFDTPIYGVELTAPVSCDASCSKVLGVPVGVGYDMGPKAQLITGDATFIDFSRRSPLVVRSVLIVTTPKPLSSLGVVTTLDYPSGRPLRHAKSRSTEYHLVSLKGLTMRVPQGMKLLGFHGLGYDFLGYPGTPNPCLSIQNGESCYALPTGGSGIVIALSVPLASVLPSRPPPLFPTTGGTSWTVDGHAARWNIPSGWLGPNQPSVSAAVEWGGPRNWLNVEAVVPGGNQKAGILAVRKIVASIRFTDSRAPSGFAPSPPVP